MSAKILRQCEGCGKEFLVDAWKLKRWPGRACSQRCRWRLPGWQAERLERATQRFWSRVNKNGPIHGVLGSRCWPWTGKPVLGGYGRTAWGFRTDDTKRNVLTHVLAFFLTHGRWPQPCGLHKCDNPPCCNPGHLFEGTRGDNNRDRHSKGRSSGGRVGPLCPARGGRNRNAKLTDEIVRAVRHEFAGGATVKSLALRYGVSNVAMSSAIRGATWKCVTS